MIKQFHAKFLVNLPFWLAAMTAALVAVAYAKIFAWSEDWALSQASSHIPLITAPLAILASFLIGHFFSKESLGSGIPQIIAAVEMASTEKVETESLLGRLLGLKMIVIKIIGSSLCVLGGGSTGREGPTLHVSAGIFYQLARRWPKSFPRPSIHFMVLAGGAGGLAAAFNTPLGGVVFAIEELSKAHINQVRTAVFQAVIVAGIISQMMLGNYLYLGHPQLDLSSHWILLQSCFIAMVVGILGAFFAECLFRIGNWRKKQSFRMQLLMTLLCGGAFALTFWLCGPATIGGGKSFMIDALNHPEAAPNILNPLARFFGNFFTYIGGVIGGIFAPALASGAAIAQYLSAEFGFEAPRIMILVGMVGFLTGVTRTPFTSFVLVLEMSDSHEAVLYLMVAAFIASLVSRFVSTKSFYEQVAHQIQSSMPVDEAPARS